MFSALRMSTSSILSPGSYYRQTRISIFQWDGFFFPDYLLLLESLPRFVSQPFEALFPLFLSRRLVLGPPFLEGWPPYPRR